MDIPNKELVSQCSFPWTLFHTPILLLKSTTVALCVTCSFNILSWDEFRIHRESSASPQSHLLSLFSIFAVVHSRQHLWSQTVSLNPPSGWQNQSMLWEVKIISTFSNKALCLKWSFSCCIATSAEASAFLWAPFRATSKKGKVNICSVHTKTYCHSLWWRNWRAQCPGWNWRRLAGRPCPWLSRFLSPTGRRKKLKWIHPGHKLYIQRSLSVCSIYSKVWFIIMHDHNNVV